MSEFSVSMCVYGKDNPEWFRAAVESVLNQSVQPSEIVLVVDGPVPNELDMIICGYEANELFNVIRLETNQGHGNARRVGLENCKYEFVALMDADDICLPTRFEKQIKVFEQQAEISIVGSDIAEFIHDEHDIIGYRKLPTIDCEIKKYLKRRCPFNQMTVMFKKKDVQNAGGYIDWYCDEDYYLWLRMYLAGMKFANIPEVLVNVRVGKEMYKRRGGWKYFLSEAKLQKFMYNNKITGFYTCVFNIFVRFIIQVLMPNQIRSLMFQNMARTKK